MRHKLALDFIFKFEILVNVLGMLVWFHTANTLTTTHVSGFERNKAVHTTSAPHPSSMCQPALVQLFTGRKNPCIHQGEIFCVAQCIGNCIWGQWNNSWTHDHEWTLQNTTQPATVYSALKNYRKECGAGKRSSHFNVLSVSMTVNFLVVLWLNERRALFSKSHAPKKSRRI